MLGGMICAGSSRCVYLPVYIDKDVFTVLSTFFIAESVIILIASQRRRQRQQQNVFTGIYLVYVRLPSVSRSLLLVLFSL